MAVAGEAKNRDVMGRKWVKRGKDCRRMGGQTAIFTRFCPEFGYAAQLGFETMAARKALPHMRES